MSQEVINQVNKLGKADGQPELLMFSNHLGFPIGNVTTASSDAPPLKNPGVEPHVKIPGVLPIKETPDKVHIKIPGVPPIV